MREVTYPHFARENGLLYWVVKSNEGECVTQLFVPKPYDSKVLYLTCSHLLGAHLGPEKTYEQILARFYWPGVKRAVQDYCHHCSECQKTAPKAHNLSFLYPSSRRNSAELPWILWDPSPSPVADTASSSSCWTMLRCAHETILLHTASARGCQGGPAPFQPGWQSIRNLNRPGVLLYV